MLADSGAPAPARDRGFLWKLQRDGRTSWLYGTVHVGRPAWVAPGPQLQAALRASSVLALEIDPEDPTLARQMADVALEAKHGTTPGGSDPSPALPAALQQRLAAAMVQVCIPPGVLSDMPPLLQAIALTVLDARWLGLDPAFGLDRTLAGLARARGLRVVSLETAADQTRALQPPDAQALQAQVGQALQQLEDGTARRVMARLIQAWEDGDLGRLSSYEAWCECVTTAEDHQLMQRMNDGRNPGLADGILALHRRGAPVFAAVGALHMTGPAALPALLAARGFRVDRVLFAPPGRTIRLDN